MSLFLLAQCGSTRMLLDVARVLEVLDAPPALGGHISWRGQVLNTLPMPTFLGVPAVPARRLIVVESGMADPALCWLVLAVESAESLLSLDDAAIADISDQPHQLEPVFAGVYSPTDSSACLLVLRFPATWALPLVAGVESP